MKTLRALTLLPILSFAAEVKPLTQEFFGVPLGISEQALADRCEAAGISIDKTSITFKDPDYPATAFKLSAALNTNPAVASVNAYLYDGTVYQISVSFRDTTEKNMAVLCASLKAKYTLIEQSVAEAFEDQHSFSATVDGVEIFIRADRDLAFSGRQAITVDYIRGDLIERVDAEHKRRKAAKVTDGL
jgi:hypothetical protein